MTYRKMIGLLRGSVGRNAAYRLKTLETRRYANGSYGVFVVERRKKLKARPTVLLVGTLHGDEPAGAYALTHHLEEMIRQSEKSAVNLLVVPCGNPYGLDKRTKYNPHNKKTNGGFVHPEIGEPSPESNRLKRLLSGSKAGYYLDLHEDKDMRGVYLYAFKDRSLAKKLLHAMAKTLPIEENPWMDDPDFKDRRIDLKNGIVFEMHDGSSEDFMSHRPGCRFAGALETPSSYFPIARRARAQADAAIELIRTAGRVRP